jgi:antitoxin CptB
MENTAKAPLNEELENRRKKLLFRSWHRGTREMDLIMGRFADATLPEYGVAELEAYEALMVENDPDLYNWITGREDIPPHCRTGVMQALIDFHNKK